MAERTDLPTKQRAPYPDEEEIVREAMRRFGQYQLYRNVHAGQWEETSQLILPTSRNTFFFGTFNWPGQKKTEQQVDATGMLALHRFSAICDSLLTPRNMMWHGLEANNPYVMKDRDTLLWFEEVRRILFRNRYAPISNFSAQNQNNFQSLGAFGNASMFIDTFDGRQHHGARGLRYKSVPLGETYFGENHQGVVDRVIRWFRMTAYQAVQKWGIEALPPGLIAALQQDSLYTYDFLHCVEPRDEDDYDPKRLDEKGMPFESYYISVQGQCLMARPGGYRSFPYAISRYDQTPGEVYGRGPAQMVLPALKTLNAEKRTFLKQGHRAADPVLLTADDGVVGMDMRPGALNKGAVTQDGKLLVHTLPAGDIQISKEMMQEERGLINDAFLVSLFQILTETPQMTATEVIERTNEKGILIAPTVGRQQSEYLGPMIDRELDLLSDQGMLPPQPRRLREARGEYQIVYTSPLARAQRSGEAAGFIRTVETAKEIVNITQDPSYLDWADFDTALPEIAQIQGTPVRWMAGDRAIKDKRQRRAKAMARQEAIQAAPAQAAMLKAQAVVAKNQPGIAPGEQGAGGPIQRPAA